MTGYTLSHRGKWTNPIFRNLLEAAIWAWMCDTAVWKSTKVRFAGELIDLERGQLVTSRRFIADGFCVGEQVTRTFLENLEKDGMVNLQPTRRGTIITICNYDKYQYSDEVANPQTNQQPTSSQPTANPNKKEINKINKDNKIKAASLADVIVPEWLGKDVWEAFVEMRKAKRNPLTAFAAKDIIKNLENFKSKGHDPTDVLRKSVVHGWAGVFEPKDERNGRVSTGKSEKRGASGWAEAVEELCGPGAPD